MVLAPGVRLGHYEIERVLGAGGMGVVYRAFDSRFSARSRSSSFCRRPSSTPTGACWRARSASALNHPNICTVHDVAEHGDNSFIVMEYVDGRPLSELIGEGLPPPAVALDMAMQVASALAHAHERNIAHGDLKAANVLVSEAGRIKVVDFGLAHRHDAAETATETSLVGGTPYAMAPEQLRGARADSRSDVWALGVFIQEIVSGSRPFVRPSVPELLAAILREAPTPPPSHVAPSVRRIIERCLARDPARRYQRAGEVLAALDALSVQAFANRKRRGDDGLDHSVAAGADRCRGQSNRPDRTREEWGQLRDAWERARTGRRQLALVAENRASARPAW